MHAYDNLISSHDGLTFRNPNDLQATEIQINRALLIGNCSADHLQKFLAKYYRIECDFVHIDAIANPSTPLPHPPTTYDLVVVIPPFDRIAPLKNSFSMKYSEPEAEEERFAASCDELARVLEIGLRLNLTGTLTLVGNFLVPQINPMGRLLPRYDLRSPRYYVEQLNRHISKILDDRINAYLLDLDGIVSTLGKKYCQDDFIWSDNHNALLSSRDYDDYERQRPESQQRLEPLGPLASYYSIQTEQCYRVISDEVVALYRAANKIDAVKLVVIDLDDTAWRGVAADEVSSSESLTLGWPLGFVEALMYIKRRGLLLAIISKNNPEKAQFVWQLAYGEFFPLSNFVSVKINWLPKPDNMHEILSECNILPSSVLYIDDSPVERAAMKAAYPGIRVLGSNPYYLRRTLLWSAELQQPTITSESSRRTEMVTSQIGRELIMRSQTHAEYLVGLNVRVHHDIIQSTEHKYFARLLELINKTNQFNTTGKRWTHSDLLAQFENGLIAHIYVVKDNLVDYGLVCIVLVLQAEIVQFVMSCRVIGLEVEDYALRFVENELYAKGTREISALAVDTESNSLSRQLFQLSSYHYDGDKWRKRLNGEAPMPAHISGSR